MAAAPVSKAGSPSGAPSGSCSAMLRPRPHRGTPWPWRRRSATAGGPEDWPPAALPRERRYAYGPPLRGARAWMSALLDVSAREAPAADLTSVAAGPRHALWVRLLHWII